MGDNRSIGAYLVLYLPWLISVALSSEPVLSYFIAWLGSFYIFYVCYSGHIKPMPTDLTLAQQIMRPVFLVQIIFVGYMACSSIFYFMSLLGYIDVELPFTSSYAGGDKIILASQCQRYYVLGHAAFTSGLLSRMSYPVKSTYTYSTSKLANTLFIVAIICLPVSIISLKIPGFSQFYFQLSSLSFIAGTLALAFAIPQQKMANTVLCGFLYISNFYQALTSGFKEPIIVSVMVLGIFLYPSYKKTVTAIFIPALLLLFTVLPTYTNTYRANAWSDDLSADEAYKAALDATLNEDEAENDKLNFLVYRISEIDMFTIFVQSTPEKIDFYGFSLVEQSVIALIPRIFWPTKPITEALVMDRVYNAGVVFRGSNVSAKPAYVVDGYLSGGAFGVFLALFVYGSVVQWISQKAEEMFGGYLLGTALIFSGLFQIFWRGLSFEFIGNSVFWSYVTMLLLHKVFLATNFLRRV